MYERSGDGTNDADLREAQVDGAARRRTRSTESPTEPVTSSALGKLKRELLEIEKRTDLTTGQKVSRIRHLTCATCAAVAIQPIPFADIFVLTPIQGLMGVKIANIHGIKISEQEGVEIVKELFGLIGLGVMAQQFAIGLYKTVLPFIGAVTTIPLVYGLTYAIGGAINFYFEEKAAGRSVDKEKLQRIFKSARKEGKAKAKDSSIEDDVHERAEQIKRDR